MKCILFCCVVSGRIWNPPLRYMHRGFGPEGVNMEKDPKALRKMQHSCIF